MPSGKFAILDDRAVVAISGQDAHGFLQGMVTANMERVAETGCGFGALLTPQGKILFDFLIVYDGERFLFDLPAASSAEFVQRLTFYKLRAKVEIADLSQDLKVSAIWETGEMPDGIIVFADPRLPALGFRAYGADTAALKEAGFTETTAEDWHRHRIALAVPEAGRDFAYGEVFPHDVDMDDLNGLDFKKGCYVGQEVVSRMHHRGTARKRIVAVSADQPLPGPGTMIEAAGKIFGTIGTSDGGTGLALVRLDRAKAAMDAGIPLTAATIAVTLTIPAWARFAWPEMTDTAETE